MVDPRADAQVQAALAAVASDRASAPEKVEMLVEIAMGLQHKPKSPEHLSQAVALYQKALEICPTEEHLLRGRVHARLGTALQAMPGDDDETLVRARDNYETARDILKRSGAPEEMAELHMNMGLVLQSLAAAGRARITDAIAAYQQALQTFDAAQFPKEFAILQNNLATAFLSIPFTDERAKMREALAVQSFEEGLKVVNLIDHPKEYAMLQNNLGNALQYVSSSHAVENNLRALEAYDEALKVRTRDAAPVEYANTICNKANCLRNLPDDAAHPERGNPRRLHAAIAHYRDAREIFRGAGDGRKLEIVEGMIAELQEEIAAGSGAGPGNGPGTGPGNGAGAADVAAQ